MKKFWSTRVTPSSMFSFSSFSRNLRAFLLRTTVAWNGSRLRRWSSQDSWIVLSPNIFNAFLHVGNRGRYYLRLTPYDPQPRISPAWFSSFLSSKNVSYALPVLILLSVLASLPSIRRMRSRSSARLTWPLNFFDTKTDNRNHKWWNFWRIFST